MEIGLVDRGRVVDDALGQIHDCHVYLVEARRAVVESDLANGLAEPLGQHLPVRE